MDEKEMMRRFFNVVSDSIEERRRFPITMGKAIDSYYYNEDGLKDMSLIIGGELACNRIIDGPEKLNQVFRTWGCDDALIQRINQWINDCEKELEESDYDDDIDDDDDNDDIFD